MQTFEFVFLFLSVLFFGGVQQKKKNLDITVLS